MIELNPAEVRRYYSTRQPELIRRGPNWRGKCPLHGGKSLSFCVDSKTGRWYCFSKCGRGGDIVGLERELAHVDFPDALRNVSAIIGRPLGNAEFTPADKRRCAAETQKVESTLPAARLWRRAALQMGEEVLALLKASVFDPSIPPARINEVFEWERQLSFWRRIDSGELVNAYLDFAARDRKLAAAIVATTWARDESEQAALARYLMELAHAA